MRKLITTTFLTLDGVMQAPGGPEEDTDGGFKEGGWSFGYWDEMLGGIMTGFMGLPFELLLGRRTYDIFAGYWPTAKNDKVIADKFNSTKKYLVSHSQRKLSWHNSSLISGDVVSEIKKLKKMKGSDLWVHGSCGLIQTLLANELIDTMHVWFVPVTVGKGKRLFGDGSKAQGWTLTGSRVASTGVIVATYEPAGAIKSGSFADPK